MVMGKVASLAEGNFHRENQLRAINQHLQLQGRMSTSVLKGELGSTPQCPLQQLIHNLLSPSSKGVPDLQETISTKSHTVNRQALNISSQGPRFCLYCFDNNNS